MIAKNRFVNAGLLLLVAMLFFVFVSDDSEAATHTVDKFGGSDYTNITQAVDNASAGDIIRVASRNYHDAVEVDKKLTIIGGNYGSEMGNLYDCNNGDLVAKYSLDEEDPSEVEDGVWCDELNGRHRPISSKLEHSCALISKFFSKNKLSIFNAISSPSRGTNKASLLRKLKP